MPTEISTRETSRVNQWQPSHPSGTVMVCGTTSNAGKSTVTAGLCRHYARRGARVAPFKAQNMSNNSAVTRAGHEIARAQAWQAMAAGVDAEVAMNPVLVKPMGERRCQVVVMGRPLGTMTAADYHRMKPELLDVVLGALADLRRRYDVVILEGAGSPSRPPGSGAPPWASRARGSWRPRRRHRPPWPARPGTGRSRGRRA